MSFTIEEIRDLDAAWSDLERLTRGIIDFHRPWDDRLLRDDWREVVRGYLVPGPDRLTLLARDDDGSAFAVISGTLSRDPSIFHEVFAYINNIFVKDGARGEGAGTALVDAFEKWAASLGASEVRLSVNAGNEAGQRFWHRAGFEINEHSMRRTLDAGVR